MADTIAASLHLPDLAGAFSDRPRVGPILKRIRTLRQPCMSEELVWDAGRFIFLYALNQVIKVLWG